MTPESIARYLTPWTLNRDRKRLRFAALRNRDGDNCWRCRRPMRFDLPAGHDKGAKVEEIVPRAAGGSAALDNFCLTHGRCNASFRDDTAEVTERVRIKSEAELFTRARKRRKG